MKLLCGCRSWILGLLYAVMSVPGMAQSPTDCLQQSQALEQSSAYLTALTALPTPPFVPVVTRGEARFVSSSFLFSEMLGVSPKSVILNDIEELKFISYTLAGTPLLLVLKAAPDWTAEKSRKVVAVAKTLKISISLVWLDEAVIPSQLATTIADSNGQSFRLNDVNRLVLQKFCLSSP